MNFSESHKNITFQFALQRTTKKSTASEKPENARIHNCLSEDLKQSAVAGQVAAAKAQHSIGNPPKKALYSEVEFSRNVVTGDFTCANQDTQTARSLAF